MMATLKIMVVLVSYLLDATCSYLRQPSTKEKAKKAKETKNKNKTNKAKYTTNNVNVLHKPSSFVLAEIMSEDNPVTDVSACT